MLFLLHKKCRTGTTFNQATITLMLKSYLVIRDSGCELDIPVELITLLKNKKFVRILENKRYQSSERTRSRFRRTGSKLTLSILGIKTKTGSRPRVVEAKRC